MHVTVTFPKMNATVRSTMMKQIIVASGRAHASVLHVSGTCESTTDVGDLIPGRVIGYHLVASKKRPGTHHYRWILAFQLVVSSTYKLSVQGSTATGPAGPPVVVTFAAIVRQPSRGLDIASPQPGDPIIADDFTPYGDLINFPLQSATMTLMQPGPPPIQVPGSKISNASYIYSDVTDFQIWSVQFDPFIPTVSPQTYTLDIIDTNNNSVSSSGLTAS